VSGSSPCRLTHRGRAFDLDVTALALQRQWRAARFTPRSPCQGHHDACELYRALVGENDLTGGVHDLHGVRPLPAFSVVSSVTAPLIVVVANKFVSSSYSNSRKV
jgi:hypothetical protein